LTGAPHVYTLADLRIEHVRKFAAAALPVIGLIGMGVSFVALFWIAEQVLGLPTYVAPGLPLIIDGIELVLAAVTVVLVGNAWRTRLSVWIWFLGFTSLSIVGNFTHALFILAPWYLPAVLRHDVLLPPEADRQVAWWLWVVIALYAAAPPVSGAVGIHTWAVLARYGGTANAQVDPATGKVITPRGKRAVVVEQRPGALARAFTSLGRFLRAAALPMFSAVLFLLLGIPAAAAYYLFVYLTPQSDYRLAALAAAVPAIGLGVLVLRARVAILAEIADVSSGRHSPDRQQSGDRPSDTTTPPPPPSKPKPPADDEQPDETDKKPPPLPPADDHYLWYAGLLDTGQAEPDSNAIVSKRGGHPGRGRSGRRAGRQRFETERGARPWDKTWSAAHPDWRPSAPPLPRADDGARTDDGPRVDGRARGSDTPGAVVHQLDAHAQPPADDDRAPDAARAASGTR
jgi:hypothetical protein